MLARLGLLLLLVGLVLAPSSHAAVPEPGTDYLVHDHATPGDNWHVEVRAHDTKRAVSVVAHSQRCDRTPFAKHVPVGADGSTKTYRPLDYDAPEKGSWSFEGRFTEAHRLDGTFRIITPDCDTGPMVFVAHNNSAHQHISYGTPMGAKPDLSKATPRRLGQADWLWKASWNKAELFWNIDDARRRGFFDSPSDYADRRAHVFHLRHEPYTRDKIYFNPRKTESLMYYNGLEGPPVLVGFMYRYKLKGGHPPFARPLLGWHAHGKGVWRGIPNQMTHVWLTNDLRSALSNCMPVEELEAALPNFEFSPMQPDVIEEARPCAPESAQ